MKKRQLTRRTVGEIRAEFAKLPSKDKLDWPLSKEEALVELSEDIKSKVAGGGLTRDEVVNGLRKAGFPATISELRELIDRLHPELTKFEKPKKSQDDSPGKAYAKAPRKQRGKEKTLPPTPMESLPATERPLSASAESMRRTAKAKSSETVQLGRQPYGPRLLHPSSDSTTRGTSPTLSNGDEV